MSRELPTGFATATSAQVVRPAILVELDWPSGMTRFWNGYGPLVYGGNTFTGAGHLGSVSPVSETMDQRANGVTLTISGIPSELVADVLSNSAQGRSGRVYLAAMSDAGALVIDPYLVFDGIIDMTPCEDSGDSASISVVLEKELIDRRSRSRRSTHEDQQIDFPGDMFFEYVAGLADKTFAWGGKTVTGAPSNAGGTGYGSTSSFGSGSNAPIINLGGVLTK